MKKLLTNPLVLAGLLLFTLVSCDELDDLLTINVPTELDESVEISVSEAGEFNISETIDLSSDELKEYSDNIDNFEAESFEIRVTDNLADGSADSEGSITLELENVTVVAGFEKGTFEQTAESIDLNVAQELVSILEQTINTGSDANLDFSVDAVSDGPVDYTVTIIIKGKFEASVN